MKSLFFSVKKQVLDHITRKGWIWISILYGCSVLFYKEFFNWLPAIFLAIYATTVLVSMMLIGYLYLGPKRVFPVGLFMKWVIVFSLLRYAYIYFFLHEHMPNYTIFHNVKRVIPTVIFTSASLLFLGYSYAIYEWGLAAREKYKEALNKSKKMYDQPIVLKSNGASVYLLPQDILYIAANGEYIDYHTSNKRYTVFKRLKAAEKELADCGLVRCHRSFIVNLHHITEVSVNEVTITGGHKIALSKTYKETVANQLQQSKIS